ncbi:prepilin peptidase [Caenispirillum salinarum]|uniref:prepilin peptidase n=1 Tax=Caenispirillum salinarum TaxID=859058 RepID=UPI00384AA1C4
MLSYGLSDMNTIADLLRTLSVLVLCGVVTYAAVVDALTFEISNTVSLVIVGAFAVWLLTGAPSSELALERLTGHLLTGGAVLIGGILLFAAGAFGGGDAKMLAAVALWAGPQWVGLLLLFTALYGGFLCLALLMARAAARRADSVPPLLEPLLSGETRVPYGIAIAAGTLTLFFVPASVAGA